jgi:CBS domain-containing protein
MKIISVEPDTTIVEALKLMLKNKIGAVLVKKGEDYVGIWTERDLMRNTITEGFDPKSAKIKDYMIKDLKTADCTDEIFQLEDKLLGMNLRHLLVKKKDKIIGLVSVRDVIQACLHDKDDELKKVNAIANWEYYENWQWMNKK